MAIISATIQITSVSIFQLILAYYLLTNPETLSTHNLTVLLAACFDLPYKPPSFATPSALSSLLAAMLAYISVNDAVAAVMHQEIFAFYWSAQAPMRTLFFFVMAIASLVSGPDGVGKIAKVLGGLQGQISASGPGREEGGLNNGVVFAWSFFMVMWWFWIYVTVRDERREMVARQQAKRA